MNHRFLESIRASNSLGSGVVRASDVPERVTAPDAVHRSTARRRCRYAFGRNRVRSVGNVLAIRRRIDGDMEVRRPVFLSCLEYACALEIEQCLAQPLAAFRIFRLVEIDCHPGRMYGLLHAIGRLTCGGSNGARHFKWLSALALMLLAQPRDERERRGTRERIAYRVKREIAVGNQPHETTRFDGLSNAARRLVKRKPLGAGVSIHAIDAFVGASERLGGAGHRRERV